MVRRSLSGRITSTLRKQRDECLCSATFLLFLQSRNPSHGWFHPQSGQGFFPQLIQKAFHKHTQRLVFMIILYLMKFITIVQHYTKLESQTTSLMAWIGGKGGIAQPIRITQNILPVLTGKVHFLELSGHGKHHQDARNCPTVITASLNHPLTWTLQDQWESIVNS